MTCSIDISWFHLVCNKLTSQYKLLNILFGLFIARKNNMPTSLTWENIWEKDLNFVNVFLILLE